MEKVERKWLILAVCGLVQIIFGLKYGIGWILGCVISRICFEGTKSYAKKSLEAGVPSGIHGHFGVNYVLMAAVLLFSAVFPNISNIFSCFMGLFTIKFSIYLSEVI